MKLVLYSGGDDRDNRELDKACMSLIRKPSPSITYIPSCSYDSEIDYYDFVKQYSKFNVTKFLHFPIDIPVDKTFVNEAFKSDMIHLSGGNTYYFIKYLRKFGYLKKLKQFVLRGGVLTGLSAGAILMTPNIETASFPEFDRDDNDENVKNFKGMGLVSFEFFPHYKNSLRYDRELIEYSYECKNPLFACPDGSGILVENNNMTLSGRAWCFYQGEKIQVNRGRPLLRRSA